MLTTLKITLFLWLAYITYWAAVNLFVKPAEPDSWLGRQLLKPATFVVMMINKLLRYTIKVIEE